MKQSETRLAGNGILNRSLADVKVFSKACDEGSEFVFSKLADVPQ
jgi:hypothetical protein